MSSSTPDTWAKSSPSYKLPYSGQYLYAIFLLFNEFKRISFKAVLVLSPTNTAPELNHEETETMRREDTTEGETCLWRDVVAFSTVS